MPGKQAISEWYENDYREGDTLVWKPSFVDVSKSGDLGYTYGSFTFTSWILQATLKKAQDSFIPSGSDRLGRELEVCLGLGA